MARRRKKYFFVWILLVLIVGLAWFRSYLKEAGYSDLNSFAADALFYIGFGALFVIPLSVAYGVRSRRSRKVSGHAFSRITRCYKCKQRIEEHTGSKCKFCGWIRCSCGACGCGRGELT